jgi:hypothetical protein
MKKSEYSLKTTFTMLDTTVMTFDEAKNRFASLGDLVSFSQRGVFLTCYFK